MKTQATPKSGPIKKTTTLGKKAPAQKSPVKAASTAEHGVQRPVTNSQSKSDDVAARAYKIWQQQGCPEGREAQHWLQAEQEISREGACASTPLS